ncbi:alpha/beta-hydrolase N-terminal domain-containing protein, partial [Gordonia sp. (in: high G+C Gram-positive bacteria)]|uniref:alpha/beta-hydrolase N-terminal domain-containing protein n=1 Tax=Gordonia sp. (in: high G+C Gram-positive bacteria) TaxID=84139 RepID=UPI002638F4F5
MSSPEAGTPDSEATEPPADDATAPAAEGATADDTPSESPAPSRWRRFGAGWQRNITHFSYAGALVGTLLLWLSFTPSLLPRGPLFQGLVSGGSAAVGYMIG